MEDDDHLNSVFYNDSEEDLKDSDEYYNIDGKLGFGHTKDLNFLCSKLRDCEQKGVLQSYQIKMIENVLNFQYITVSDIMTHRIDILAVDSGATLVDVLKLSVKYGLSRIPVFRNNIDTIVGAVFVKDLIKILMKPGALSEKIAPYVRELLYVPKSTKCVDLFIELTKNHTHMAVVVDDFGGTFGIVTLEDIIETIFGQIQDEYDNEVEEIKKINNKTYIIQGYANLKDVFAVLNLDVDKNLQYETLSGFLINLLGHIPEKHEQPKISYKNYEFNVLSIEKHHIDKVKVTRHSV